MTIKEREELRVVIELLHEVGAMCLTLKQAHLLMTVNDKLFYLAEA